MKNKILLIGFLVIISQIVIAQKKDIVDFLKENPTANGSYYSIAAAKKHPEKVKHLTLEGIKAFPVEILKFKNLVELDLTGNDIKQIPIWVQSLKSLQILTLRNNQLQDLPEFVFHLPSLKELDVWGNSISGFSIDHLLTNTQLEYLNLSMNKFSQIPASIVKLTSLKKLMVENNHLTKIPSEIFKMRKLESIYLFHNDISNFDAPDHIEGHLKIINLSQNPIYEFQINKLKELLPGCEINYRES